MFDFTFHNPTRIIFGKDTETRIGQELKQAGLGRVLLVYGRESIKRSGLYDRVTQSLKTNNIAWVEHAGVSSNPLLSHVRAGVELAKKAGVDGLLAVGGGSVLDEAKAIAVGALAADDIWHYFIGTEDRRPAGLHGTDHSRHRQRDERQRGGHQRGHPAEICHPQ